MRDIYLIYIVLPNKVFDSRIKYLMDSKYNTFRHKDGIVTGLYAWSNKKSIVKKFIDTRTDIFDVKKKEISDKVYKKYKKDYSDLKLEERRFYSDTALRESYHKYIDDKNPVSDNDFADVVTTKFEFVASTIEMKENMMAFGPAAFLSFDYKLFNERIIEALDILQYNLLYDIYVPTNPESDEMFERKDVADYNASFSRTNRGNEIFSFDNDEYITLLYLFSYTFFGV